MKMGIKKIILEFIRHSKWPITFLNFKVKKASLLKPLKFSVSLYYRILFFCFGETLLNAPCDGLINKFQRCCYTKNSKCRIQIFSNICVNCCYSRSYGNKKYCEKYIAKQILRGFLLNPEKKQSVETKGKR